LLVDLEDADEVAFAKAVNRRLADKVLALGGTCGGEHGVGYGRIDWLEASTAPVRCAPCAASKQALDPDNIMSQGKIFLLDDS
jgi:D-lactate dehydrogenase (cytochrome)